MHAWHEREPWQQTRLDVILAGNLRGPSWSEPARPVVLEDVKGIVEWLITRLGGGAVTYVRADTPAPGVEHPGRTAVVVVEHDGKQLELGRLGELDPRYVAANEVRAEHALFASLDLEAMAGLARTVPEVRDLAALPAVEFDVAIVVPRDLESGRVTQVLRQHAGPMLARLTLFDRYQGAPLGADEISLAYRLRFQPTDAGPTDAQLAELMADIEDAIADELGGRVRSG